MKGIDISDNQGKIDWEQVKGAGVEFVILRTTRRSGDPDKYLASNIRSLKEFDIPFDFYKYSYAASTAEAFSEASRVVEVLKGYGVVPDQDTVIYMDVEDKVQFALSTRDLTEIIKVWKNVIITSGYSFGLYMGKYYYEHNEVDLSAFNDLTWIARYYNGYVQMAFDADPNEKYMPTSRSGELRGWQYTSSGIVPGIKGTVDLDIYYGEIKPTTIDVSYYTTPEFTLIDALNKIGVDSSYKNRKKIADKNGIKDYSGTRDQNLQMYQMLMEGKLVK